MGPVWRRTAWGHTAELDERLTFAFRRVLVTCAGELAMLHKAFDKQCAFTNPNPQAPLRKSSPWEWSLRRIRISTSAHAAMTAICSAILISMKRDVRSHL